MAYKPPASIEQDVKNLVQLSELRDVDLTGITVNQVIQWNGSLWLPASIILNNLDNTDIVSPNDQEALIYDSTTSTWKNTDIFPLAGSTDISNITFQASDYAVGQNIDITLEFASDVTVSNNPQIITQADSGQIVFDYNSQPQSNRVVFRYTVQVGDSELSSLIIETLSYTNGQVRKGTSNAVDLGVSFYTGITIGGGSPVLNDWYNLSPATNANIVSFSDNNQISINGSVVTTLNEGQVFNTSASPNDRVSSTGGVCVWGQNGSAYGTWDVTNFSGRSFTQWVVRSSPLVLSMRAFANPAVVETFTNGVSNGTTNVPANTRVQVLVGTNSTNLTVTSDEDILCHLVSNNGQDSRPLFPATLEVFGIPSGSADCVSLGTGTVTLADSNGATSSFGIGPTSGQSIGGSSNYAGPAIRASSTVPIGILSTADSDGTEATTWLPRTLMGTVFFTPTACEFVAFATENENVNIDVFAPGNYVTPITTLFAAGQDGFPGFVRYIPTSRSAAIPAGTKFVVASGRAYAVAEQGSNDETVLIGL